MITALTTITQLTAADFKRRKQRWISAAAFYAVGGIAGLFAVGFGAVAGTVAIARSYDLLVALVIMSAIFLAIAALAVIVNAALAARARRRNSRSAAVKSAALATGLVAIRRSGTTALPLIAAIAGLLLASRLVGEDEAGDE